MLGAAAPYRLIRSRSRSIHRVDLALFLTLLLLTLVLFGVAPVTS